MRNRAWAVLGVVSVAASGCFNISLWNPPPPEEPEPFDTGRQIEEDPGPAIVTGVDGPGFAYGPDGGEIVFLARATSGSAEEVQGMTLADGSRRTLSDFPVGSPASWVLTSDGGGLYYVAKDPSGSARMVLREALSRTDVDLGGWQPYALTAAGDSAWLLVEAYQAYPGSGEGIRRSFALERATGTLVPTPCDGSEHASFSPAADEVLCVVEPDGAVRFRLDDQVTQRLLGLTECQGSFSVVFWGSEGLRVACDVGATPTGPWTIYVGDPEAGRTITRSPVTGSQLKLGGFSPDGSALAFAEGECLAGEKLESTGGIVICTRLEWHVRVLDVAAGEVGSIASSGNAPGAMSFSADGKTLTYVLGNTIHARPSGR